MHTPTQPPLPIDLKLSPAASPPAKSPAAAIVGTVLLLLGIATLVHANVAMYQGERREAVRDSVAAEEQAQARVDADLNEMDRQSRREFSGAHAR